MKSYTFVSVKLFALFSGLHNGKLPKNSMKSKTEYIYENHIYTFDEGYLQLDWSKSKIRVFLYIVSCSNPEGISTFLEDEVIAKYTNLSVRTVIKALNDFQKAGLLTFQRIDSKASNIQIHNFQENVRDVYKTDDTVDGVSTPNITVKTGYTSLSAADIENLLSLDTINELRVALRVFAWYEKAIHLQGKDTWYISYPMLSMAVPKYLKYPAAIESILTKLSPLFPISCISGYENRKKEFKSYGNRHVSLAETFSHRIVGVLERFKDAKTCRSEELQLCSSEFIRFGFEMSKHGITIPQLKGPFLSTVVDTFGLPKFKATLNKVRGYLNMMDPDGVRLITLQLKSDTENYLYSILKRINLDLHSASAIS